jgi:hypothetical protein
MSWRSRARHTDRIYQSGLSFDLGRGDKALKRGLALC